MNSALLSGIVLVMALAFMTSCHSGSEFAEPEADSTLIHTDQAFSQMSESRGMKQAFLNFMDSGGILLRPGHLPIIGDAARKYLQNAVDSTYRLTWEVSGARMALAGDLGYTYGLYSLKLKDTTLRGTYVSIWKRQTDGKWKFVLDSGNEGTGQP